MDWHQQQFDWAGLEKRARADLGRNHALACGCSDLQARLIHYLLWKGRIEHENEVTRSVLIVSTRALCRVLECSIGGLSDAASKLAVTQKNPVGCLQKQSMGQRGSRWILSWPRLFGMRQMFGGVRCSVFDRDRTPPNTTEHRTSVTSSSLQQEEQENPPPPPLKNGDVTWQEAEAAVIAHLTDWQNPIEAAKKHVTAAYVMAVVAHYCAANGAWGPGALHRRLCSSHPAAAPDDDATWPPKRQIAKQPRDRRAMASGLRYQIIRAGRRAGRTDEEIEAELSAAGLEW